MTDFETHPVGTAKRLEAANDMLEALEKIRDMSPATYAHDYADMRGDTWEIACAAITKATQ